MKDHQHHPDLAGSWDWLAFAAQLPAKPVAVPASGGSGLLMSGRCILAGVCVWNTSASAGTMAIYDGTSTNALAVLAQHVPATGNVAPTMPAAGVLLERGAYLEVSVATLLGAVYLIPLWHYADTAPGT